jgi:hypothetical protein
MIRSRKQRLRLDTPNLQAVSWSNTEKWTRGQWQEWLESLQPATRLTFRWRKPLIEAISAAFRGASLCGYSWLMVPSRVVWELPMTHPAW